MKNFKSEFFFNFSVKNPRKLKKIFYQGGFIPQYPLALRNNKLFSKNNNSLFRKLI